MWATPLSPLSKQECKKALEALIPDDYKAEMGEFQDPLKIDVDAELAHALSREEERIFGEPDVALFDFTSMFAASNSTFVKEKNGKQLLCALVGDGLLEVLIQSANGCFSSLD